MAAKLIAAKSSSLVNRASALFGRLTGRASGTPLDEPSREFADFCRHRWPGRASAGRPLILMHQIEWYPAILCYAFVAQALARRGGAALASYGFGRTGRPLDELFASFGAASILGPRQLERFAPRANKLAGEIFAGLRTRRDVVNITIEGFSIGDLIYDSYLRYYFCATVDLEDVRLRDVIAGALMRFFASRELLETREVAMVFVDHAVYMDGGVLARLAIARGIPVFHVPYNPATLLPIDPATFQAEPGDPRGRPAGIGSCKLVLPYHLFGKVFASLPAAGRAERLQRGRANLESRLSGKFDPGVLTGGSAYHAASGPRVTSNSGRPKVLVMLHDYCDAPHAFRNLLFEDHYQWSAWLFERSAQTPYEWYVKPHPNAAHDVSKGQVNNVITAEFRERFPHLHFVPPGTSNRQLISEGISAIFTGYGTVGHEFAFFGVPAVTAGDNPHVNWNFNFNPRSIEELAGYVDRAGELTADIDVTEIEEYAYMRYLHYYDRSFHTVSFVPPGMEENPETFRQVAGSGIFRTALENPDAREAQLDEYLERLFADGRHRLPV
jgi:hypothetical protein